MLFKKFQSIVENRWVDLKSSLEKHFRDNPLYNYIGLLLFAVLVGVTAGAATIGFYTLIKSLHYFFFVYIVEHVSQFPRAGIVLFPIIGGVLVSLMIKLAPQLAQQQGVVEIIKANFITTGLIRFKTVLYQFVAPVFFLGSGGTLGPEAPSAQLGAGVGSLLGQLFHLRVPGQRIFLAAGTAAAIAAVFNAPIGSVFFALEIVLFNNFRTLTFSALIVAAVAGDYISRLVLADRPLLSLPVAPLTLSPQIMLFGVLGVLAGFISLLFIKSSLWLHDWTKRHLKRVSPFVKIVPLMGLLGVISLYFPQLLGIGYDSIKAIAAARLEAFFLLGLVVFKFIFVLLLHEAGGFGGLFAPSLFIGAGIGTLFAYFFNGILGTDLSIAACAISGMAAVLAGINSIPVTALMIIVELTGNYHLVLPLMLSIIFSYIVVHYFLRESVYAIELKRQGIQLYDGKELNVLKNIKIKQIMSPEFHKVYATMNLRTIIKIIAASSANIYWVEDNKGKLIGYISWSDLKPLITDFENLEPLVLVSDVMNPNLVTVKPDDNLDYVMKLFGGTNLDELPVVDPESQRLVGTVFRNRVIQLYNQEIFKRETAGDLAAQLRYANQARFVEIDDDFAILEINAPDELVNKDLQALNLRNRYDLQVVLIKRRSGSRGKAFLIPRANTVLLPGDVLILVGQTRKIHDFRERYY